MVVGHRIVAAALAALLVLPLAACKPKLPPPDEQLAEIAAAGAFTEVLEIELADAGEGQTVSVWVRQPDGRSQQWTRNRDGVTAGEPQELTWPGPGIPVSEVDLAALVSVHDRYQSGDCAEAKAHLATLPTGGQAGWVGCGYPERYASGSSTLDGAPVSQDSFDLANQADIEHLGEFLAMLVPEGELVELSQHVSGLPGLNALAPSISLPGGYCQPAWISLSGETEQGEGFPVRVECHHGAEGMLSAEPDHRPTFSLGEYEASELAGIWQEVAAAGMTRQDVSGITYTAGEGRVLNYTITSTDPYRFPLISGTIAPR